MRNMVILLSLIIIVLGGAALLLFVYDAQSDTIALELSQELRHAKLQAEKSLISDKTALEKAKLQTALRKELSAQRMISFWEATKKYSSMSTVIVSLLTLLIVGIAFAKWLTTHEAQLDEHTRIPLRNKDLKGSMSLATAYLSVKEAAALSDNRQEAFQMFMQLAQTAASVNRSLPQAIATTIQTSERPALQAGPVPNFRQLLQQGMIAPGKPLLIGFTRNNTPVTSELADNYSTVVIGQSGTGKTTGEAYNIAQTILAYNARYTILDPHYPDKHGESLGDRLGALRSLPNIRIFNNPYNLDAVVEELDAEFEQYKLTGVGHVPHIIVVDEHALWKNATNGGKEFLRFEEKIIYQGRKYGWYLHVTSKSPLAQDFGSSAVRDNFVTSLLYKTKKQQSQTFFKDADLVELAQACDKPGMAVYTDRHDQSNVITVPYCDVQDMETVVKLIGNGPPITTAKKPVETTEKPEGVIHLSNFKHHRSEKKPVVSPDAKKPGETTVIAALNQRCENRPAGMSKNQWIHALAEATGYSDSYIKNVLLENTNLTPDIEQKFTRFLQKNQENQ